MKSITLRIQPGAITLDGDDGTHLVHPVPASTPSGGWVQMFGLGGGPIELMILARSVPPPTPPTGIPTKRRRWWSHRTDPTT